MSVQRAFGMVHPTATRGHTRVIILDQPVRGVFELFDAAGDRPGQPTRRLYRGPARRHALRRLGGWLEYHRTLGFHDQLALPVAWQGWLAATGSLADTVPPIDRLGRWQPLGVDSAPLRTIAAYARSGDYSVEVLPAAPGHLRRVWIVGHPDGGYDMRDAADLSSLSPGGAMSRELRASVARLRALAPWVVDAVVTVRNGRLAGPIAAMDLLMSAGVRLADLSYRERSRHLLELLVRDSTDTIVPLDPMPPNRMRAGDAAAWARVRLIAYDSPYDPENPDGRMIVLRSGSRLGS